MFTCKIDFPKWEKIRIKEYVVYFKGDIRTELICFIEKFDISPEAFKAFLSIEKSHFSIIFCGKELIYAAVDRVASAPLFYDGNAIYDTDCIPRKTKINPTYIPEYSMSGYVLGNATLSDELSQICAGEFLLRDSKSKMLECQSYYHYYPSQKAEEKKQIDYVDELSHLTDIAIDSAICKADGRKIVLPLSGGLDSRLLLCKLHEKKYDNLHVFTYGVKNSHEALMAKAVCSKLGVKWHFVSYDDLNLKQQGFQNYLDGYLKKSPLVSVIPSFLEVLGFYKLLITNQISHEDFIINGQSGDFTSGAHIRLDLIGDITKENLFRYMFQKHFSLFSILNTEENKNGIYKKFEKHFQQLQSEIDSPVHLLGFCEWWEWKERQSKLVLGGQRLYESIGCDWDLPLWHPRLMTFWMNVPYDLKINQNLYVKYLSCYNYKNVFDVLRRPPKPWTTKYIWIKYFAQIISLFLGKSNKKNYYKYMDYYSTYADQYRILGRKLYKENWRIIKNPNSLITLYILDYFGYDHRTIFKADLKV